MGRGIGMIPVSYTHLDSLAVRTRKEIEGLALVVGQSHLLQDCHVRTRSHGRILVYAANAALTLVFRLSLIHILRSSRALTGSISQELHRQSAILRLN